MKGSLYVHLAMVDFELSAIFFIRVFLRLGTVRWHVVTKGRIFISTDFLSLNLTSDVILSTRLLG